MRLDARVGILTTFWGGQFGGAISTGILVKKLHEAGAGVTVILTKQRRELSNLEGAGDNKLENKVEYIYPIGWAGIFKKILMLDCIVIVGDRPKLFYILMQLIKPVVFLRLDTILTCPAGTRYLPGSSLVCTQGAGLCCLKTNKIEGCMGQASYLRKLCRIFARKMDMILVRLFYNFVTNSKACAVRHRRSSHVFHPPCPSPVNDKREVGNVDLIFVARLVTSKGGVDAIEILKRSARAGLLHIIGDGPERPQMEAAVEREGLRNRVVFHGWLSPHQRDELMKRCGVTIMCSKWDEAFGRIGPESYALGTPVVAYDVGGVSEWCQEPAGMLVRCGDTIGAALDVDILLSDHDRWSEASERARHYANRFSDNRYAGEWISYLNGIIYKE